MIKKRIGYFVPEFPGQTHMFFLREVKALKELGHSILTISTKRPPPAIISHRIDDSLQTLYLYPFVLPVFINSLVELLRSGPKRWYQCLKVVFCSNGISNHERLRIFSLIFIGAELTYTARKNGLEHIHVHSCADSAHIALFANILSNVKYSITLHGPLKDYGANQNLKWSHSEFAIIITNKLFKEAHEELSGYLPQKVDIAPMGVELDKFTRKTQYKVFRQNDICQLFTCGRLNPTKGHQFLLRAIKQLIDMGLNVKLTIAGEDEYGGEGYRKQLEDLVENLGIKPYVSLAGAISEKEIINYLENSHIFVLASKCEPLGVAIMEAMSMELPVIINGAGGVKELVDHNHSGLLLSSQNPDEIVTAINYILENPDVAESLGVAARKKIAQSFSSRVSANLISKNIQDSN